MTQIPSPNRFQDKLENSQDGNTSSYGTEPPSLDMAWYGIGFTDAVKRGFQKFATFSGRASRGEFWWFQLAWALAIFACLFVSFISGILLTDDSLLALGMPALIVVSLLSIVVFWVPIIPSFALACRRLHDIGKSGWTLFWAVICTLLLGIASIALPIMAIASSDYSPDVAPTALALYIIPGIIAGIISLYLTVLYATASDPTSNEYGPGPYGNVNDIIFTKPTYPRTRTEEIGTFNNTDRTIQLEEEVISELNTEIANINEELAAVSMQINSISQEESGTSQYKTVMKDLSDMQMELASKVQKLQNERAMRQEFLDEKREERTRLTRLAANLPSSTGQTQTPPTTPPPLPPTPQPPTPPSPPDPILAELATPDTPATRLHEIATLATEHPEYRVLLLKHPNTYPELANWIRKL